MSLYYLKFIAFFFFFTWSVRPTVQAQSLLRTSQYKHVLETSPVTFKYIPLFQLDNISLDLPISNAIEKSVIDLSDIQFNARDMATFCRLELELEKATKFPIKIRIGEVQYVERLEGKYD